MRIIGGQFKRRRLLGPPEGSTTRPIPDLVREAVFNLLRGHFEDEVVYDAFAGVGSFGLEAISRGAKRAVMVERDRRVVSVLEANAKELGVFDQVEIVAGDALGAGALARCPRGVHIVFFDPPYAMVQNPQTWPRLKAHFEQLIQRLDETGYALLRTPWPAVFREQESMGQGSAGRGDDEQDEFGSEDISEDGGDTLVDGGDDGLGEPRAGKVPVPLEMVGALGPETHDYGSTAVHLYMRAPGGEAGR